MPLDSPHIGQLRERPLHRSLKQRYATDGSTVEAPVGPYVVDVAGEGWLVEIQTRGFSSIKHKLYDLVESHRVLLVHPVPVDTWLVKLDPDGDGFTRRRSPRHGSALDLFAELVSFPTLIDHPQFAIDVVLTSEEQVRRYDGVKGWRRKGWLVESRSLIDVYDTLRFDSSADLADLLPEDLEEPFTTATLAERIGRPRRLAQQMAFCLREAGAIRIDGKSGNTLRYVRA